MSQAILASYVVLGSILVIAAVLAGLSHSLVKAGWAARQRRATLTAVALVLMAWAGATTVLAWLDAYQGGPGRFPMLPVAILAPVVVGALLIRPSAATWRLIEAVPQQWLVGVQLYRAGGAVFLVLWAGGQLPGLFALPAGLGDVATGLLAPVAALAWARNPANGTAAIRRWNLLGIGDLVVAFITGWATGPRLAPLLGIEAPNVLIDRFPLVLIPAFIVPLSALLHFASLAKLRQAVGRSAPAAGSVASA